MNPLQKKLDDKFSEYIRTKDADEFGIVKCYTCPEWEHWKRMDCGHFISRKYTALRWDERQCKPQCPLCNRAKDGMNNVFKANLIRENGEEFVESLEIDKHQTIQMRDEDYKLLIEQFTGLIAQNKLKFISGFSQKSESRLPPSG